jgi:hypothetical protein
MSFKAHDQTLCEWRTLHGCYSESLKHASLLLGRDDRRQSIRVERGDLRDVMSSNIVYTGVVKAGWRIFGRVARCDRRSSPWLTLEVRAS